MKHADLCIYVTGSLVVSKHPNIRIWTYSSSKEVPRTTKRMSYIDKTLMDASLICKCRDMAFRNSQVMASI